MFKKPLLVFISLRIIGILFTFNIFNQLQRGYGDARFLIGKMTKQVANKIILFVTKLFSEIS